MVHSEPGCPAPRAARALDVEARLLLVAARRRVVVGVDGGARAVGGAGEPEVEDLEPGVYPLQPTPKVWFVNEHTKVKAKRTGFNAVPYFSGTAFMFQGASKDAIITDCLEVAHVSKQRDAISTYVANSRVKTDEGILIMQPFSSGLFAHGPPPGPHILMRLLRREISPDDVDAEFEKLRRDAKE